MTAVERRDEFNRLYRAGVELAQAQKEVEAELAFARAAAFAPELWCDVATKLAQEGQQDMALEHFKTALQITAHAGIRSGIYNNVANIYAQRGQLHEALEMNDLALKEDPQSGDAYCNRGQICKWLGQMGDADRYTERALAVNPWHNEAQFLQALNALDRGDYDQGWELYEARFRSRTNGTRRIECFQPEWPGPSSVDFRTGRPFEKLFVYTEQGAGDVFLMLRYAPLIRALGLHQHWALKPGMGKLVGDLVDSYSDCAGPLNELAPAEFDCHIPSASLPRLFGTTLKNIPAPPYLPAPPRKDFGPGFHVGIAWRGNKGQFNDAIRSSALADWKPVLEVQHPGLQFHSLQVDGADEAMFYPRLKIEPLSRDWHETAAQLAGLDLLISVDTGIVHLAGAMGLPVWCALHCRPYFVYPIALDHTPWYPTVRLFKQERAFKWDRVFETIALELKRFVARCYYSHQ